jgi:hypothetical protein
MRVTHIETFKVPTFKIPTLKFNPISIPKAPDIPSLPDAPHTIKPPSVSATPNLSVNVSVPTVAKSNSLIRKYPKLAAAGVTGAGLLAYSTVTGVPLEDAAKQLASMGTEQLGDVIKELAPVAGELAGAAGSGLLEGLGIDGTTVMLIGGGLAALLIVALLVSMDD